MTAIVITILLITTLAPIASSVQASHSTGVPQSATTIPAKTVVGPRANQPTSTLNAITTIQINGATRYQTIEGFGVNANPRSWDLVTPGSFTPQLDTLIDNTGASIWRVAIESHENWETTNDNADPNTFDWTYYNSLYETDKFKKLWAMLAYLDSKGVNKIYLVVMGCLPTWMEVANNRCVLPSDGSKDDEWVEMMSSMLYYARVTKNLRIDVFSPMNESDLTSPTAMEGPKMSAARYGVLVKKLATKLDAIGLSSLRLTGPDVALSSNTQSYMNALFPDSALMAKYDHVAAHSYSGDSGNLITTISGSSYPSLTPWISEYSGLCPGFKCDNGIPVTAAENWAFSVDTFDYLMSHLNSGVTAAMVWEAYDSYYEHHMTYTYWGLIGYNTATSVYSPTKRLYIAQQTDRFIQAGMQRISALSGDTNTIIINAFHNAATGKLTLVGRNKTSIAQTLTVNISGVGSPGALNLYQTSKSLDMAAGGSISPSGSTYTVNLAADSVFTLTNVALPAPADTQNPTVAFTAPASAATVSGASVLITVNASDNVGVAGIQFKLDGANLGAEQSAANPSFTWNSTGVANGSHTLGVTVRDAAGNTASATRTITVNNAPPSDTQNPTVAFTTPASAATVSGASVLITVNASDNVGVAGIQFKLDGANLGAEQSAANPSLSWDSTGVADGSHTLGVTVRDAAGNTASATRTITVNNAPPPDTQNPTVAFTTPASAATVSGTSVLITVNASDNVGVAGIQFKLDGGNLGAEQSAANPSLSWDSTGVANGSHTLGVTVRDAAGNTASAARTITVSNTVIPSGDTQNPTVTFTAPANAATVSGASVLITVSASDNVGVAGIQFKLNGANLGTEQSAASPRITWDSTSVPNGTYTLGVTVRDAAGNKASATRSITVSNTSTPTPSGDTQSPTVAFTAPASAATVSGASVLIAVSASDNVGVASIQFQLNGANLSSMQSAANPSFTWDSTSVPNGTYTLGVTVRDAAGNTASATRTITVNNSGLFKLYLPLFFV